MPVPRSLVVSIGMTVVLTVLWGCASAVYNWGSVGGWVSPNFERWYAVGEVVPYLSLAAWACAIGLSANFAFARPRRAHFAWILASVASAPSTLLATLWVCQRGFPAPAN
jgi:hypothetical protein